MKIRYLLITLSICCFWQIDAQEYVIDSGHSAVMIKVERFGVVDVVGRFKDVSGTINYNEDISKMTANAIVKVDSYDANNIGGEKAVKSKAFLDAEKYPEITFKSIEVSSKNGSNSLIGELTIHGVTNTIELPFTSIGPLMDLAAKKQSIAFNASTTINRQDYGVSFNKALPNGTKIVGDDVEITLTILAVAK